MVSTKQLEITDYDISWASQLLGLPENAFQGGDQNDPRQEVMKSLESIYVTACPGSGKTTLLVAKLAVLTEKWQSRTTGICVLSHTNVAREEIETFLGNTATGPRLLSYPHYIGTIHGFVNEFLALPALRSGGITGTQFSTEISGSKIWKLSGYGKALPKYLFTKIKDPEKRKAAVLNTHYVGENLDLQLGIVKLRSKSKSEAFETIKNLKRRVLREGYASFDDTFAFGHWALKQYPYLTTALRDRFPLVFVDETQDNSEEQSQILHRIFLQGKSNIILQAFGDQNQAIFDSMNIEGAEQDAFSSGVKKDLPNSHRFGQEIATLASSLGVVQHSSALKGCGPKNSLVSGLKAPNTIFLFENESLPKVLNAYTDLLLRTFSKDELERGIFTAVGAVHRAPVNEEPHKYPHHVGHFWPEYDPELTKRDHEPQHFMQHVFMGLGRAAASGESDSCVEKIAYAFLHLVRMSKVSKDLPRRRRSHRHLLELLDDKPEMRSRYNELLIALCISGESLTSRSWDMKWRSLVKEIAESAAGGPLDAQDADEFLTWKDERSKGLDQMTSAKKRGFDNIYKYPPGSPKVSIRFGSIHSVKGQTHTATLILETFWRKHNLDVLKPWILGLRTGLGKKDGIDQEKRLKLHYVAMTRPTHLVCLAMKRSSFLNSDGELDPKQLLHLKTRGWKIEVVQ